MRRAITTLLSLNRAPFTLTQSTENAIATITLMVFSYSVRESVNSIQEYDGLDSSLDIALRRLMKF